MHERRGELTLVITIEYLTEMVKIIEPLKNSTYLLQATYEESKKTNKE